LGGQVGGGEGPGRGGVALSGRDERMGGDGRQWNGGEKRPPKEMRLKK